MFGAVDTLISDEITEVASVNQTTFVEQEGVKKC